MKEQIEDIAKIIHDSDIADINTFPVSMSECLGKHGARRTGAAIALVKAGYRKQSEGRGFGNTMHLMILKDILCVSCVPAVA